MEIQLFTAIGFGLIILLKMVRASLQRFYSNDDLEIRSLQQ
jgi:hypothetical protein